jgi:hypothetical protein
MSIESLTAQVLDLTTQTTALLSKMSTLENVLWNGIQGQVTSLQNPVITLNHDMSVLAAGFTRDIELNSAVQFSVLATVVFGVVITSSSPLKYSVELLTKGVSEVEHSAYLTSALIGNFKDQLPFTVIKAANADKVIMRIKNYGASSLSGVNIKMFTLEVK